MEVVMKATMKKNGGSPSVWSNVFAPDSFFGRDFSEVMPDLFARRLGINVPPANITENVGEFILELGAPGLTREDFRIELDDHFLSISCEKTHERNDLEGDYSKREFSYHSFTRTFQMPENSKLEKVDARYENGILRITRAS
jgi:HSP20 family protein